MLSVLEKISAQARKDLQQIARDRLTLIMVLGLPLLMVVMLGTTISQKLTLLPIVIQDLDNTPQSRQYIDQLKAAHSFQILDWSLDSRPELALAGNQAYAAIIIPPHFERDILRVKSSEVQILIDATDANTARLIRNKIDATTEAYQDNLNLINYTINNDSNSISNSISNSNLHSEIKTDMRFWFNPGQESSNYIGPAVFAVVLALFAPLLPALSISGEFERNTIYQVYSANLSALEFLLGKFTAFLIIAIMEWLMAIIVTILLFNFTIIGDASLMLIGTIFYLSSNISLGILIGTLIPNQAAAIQATQISGFVLSFLLSGMIYPIANMPLIMGVITQFVPTRYYVELTRAMFVRGGSWQNLWQIPLSLALLSLLFLFISWRQIREMQVNK